MVQFLISAKLDPSGAIKGVVEVEKALDRTKRSSDRLFDSLKRAFQIFGSTLAVRQILEVADAYQNVQNKLRVVTTGEEDLAFVTERLLSVSNQTRSSFESTATIYSRLALSSKELGRSQAELLVFTQSLNQAVIASGATSREASNALIQLSQGIASGALKGDELRSVLEQLPVVADVIAKSLGVTRGELRKLGSEGKITGDVILDAFKSAREEISEKFGKTVPTISQGFEQIKNETLALVGATDQATGSFTGLAKVLGSVAEGMKNAREFYSGFAQDARELQVDAELSKVGQQINGILRELRSLESREFFSDATLDRIGVLNARLRELRGLAPQVTKALEPEKKQQEATKQEKARAKAIQDLINELEREEAVSKQLLLGREDLAEVEERIFDLRKKRIELTDKEREALVFLVQHNLALHDQAEAYQGLVGPQEEARRGLEALSELLRQYPELTSEITRAMDELRLKALESALDLGSGFERAFIKLRLEATNLAAVGEDVVNAFADNATNALAEFARTGSLNFREFANSLLDDITRIITRLLVVQALSGLFGGGGTSGLLGDLGIGLFGGGREHGGPVHAGVSYVVGEGGEPELFTPGRSGTVTPLSEASQASPSVNLQVVNVDDPNAIPAAINDGLADEAIINVLARNPQKVNRALGSA